MPRRTKVLIALAVGALLVTAAVAPFALMLLPNPVPVRVGDPAGQLPGTYVATGGAFYHVVQFAQPAAEYPADSLTAEPGAHVVIRYKGLDDLAAYGVYRYPDGLEVSTTKRVDGAKRVLELIPRGPLAPGRYSVTVSSDDPFTGAEYAYFSVSASSAARTQPGAP